MNNFITKWLMVTVVILLALSIMIYDAGNPDSALGGLVLFMFGIPISTAVMGIIWWKRLSDENKLKTSNKIRAGVMMFPFALLVFFGIWSGLDSFRWERVRQNTIHTHIMTIEVDDYTLEQRYFLRSDGNLGTNYGLLYITIVTLKNENLQREFENFFSVELPDINFRQYYFLVLPGREYDGCALLRTTRRVDPRIINVYQVNIVR